MPIDQLSASKPTVRLKVTGQMTSADLAWLQSKSLSAIRSWGRISALVILEDFEGWKKGPGWDDMSFANENDWSIDRIAIVGPEEWRELVCVFTGRGLRSVAVEYFLPSQLEQAQTWLKEGSGSIGAPNVR